ncbi:hypothetical protein SDC9_189987 [bioreactor metagenome]|uniref:Uncharacterized protein n=1 Tax=bioreactor metagenome TaxID=1076179 RepID=A0A645HU94_9ZZZZ
MPGGLLSGDGRFRRPAGDVVREGGLQRVLLDELEVPLRVDLDRDLFFHGAELRRDASFLHEVVEILDGRLRLLLHPFVRQIPKIQPRMRGKTRNAQENGAQHAEKRDTAEPSHPRNPPLSGRPLADPALSLHCRQYSATMRVRAMQMLHEIPWI